MRAHYPSGRWWVMRSGRYGGRERHDRPESSVATWSRPLHFTGTWQRYVLHRRTALCSLGIERHDAIDFLRHVGEARGLSLPVGNDVPEEIYRIMALYPQTAQRRPSVEYIPLPRSREVERPGHRGTR